MKRLAILILAVTSLLMGQSAFADGEQCGAGPKWTLSEATGGLSGEYNIYVKLSLPGQNADITGFVATDSCQAIGTVTANGNTWSRVGSVTFEPESLVSFEIDGDIPGNNDAAAKPQLLMVPIAMPCEPKITCKTVINQTPAYLSPVSLTTSSSGIAIQRIIDPTTDSINRVEYYTDGQLMYTLKELRPFNVAYADYYQQKSARVIVYNSGQRAVLEDIVTSYTDNPANFAARTFVRHSTLMITIGIALLLSIIIFSARVLARRIEAKNYYEYAHGLGTHVLTPLEAKVHAIAQNRTVRSVNDGLLLLSGIVTAIILVNTFIIAPYRVDGTSMYATLKDSQLLAVNKLPVSLNRQFKPVRGQVIIYHPNYGNLAYSELREEGMLVKRIAGLPGERITSVNGKLKVYNTAYPLGYILEDNEPWANKVTIQNEDAPFDITLANNQIFVAGDNRPDSLDSRINGALPLSEVVGVVIGY